MRLDEFVEEGEAVVMDVRPHWSTVARPVLVVTIIVVAEITAAVVAPGLPAAAWIGLAVVVLAALCWLGGRYARWVCTRLVVTTERVVSEQGVLRRRWHQTPMMRITDVGVEQGLLERLLRKGSLLIESGSPRGADRLSNVPSPWRVEVAISRQMDLLRRRQAGIEAAPVGTVSVAQQIEKLDELWRRGVIDEVELSHKSPMTAMRLHRWLGELEKAAQQARRALEQAEGR